MAAFLPLLLIFWIPLCYAQSQGPSSQMMTISPRTITLTPSTISMRAPLTMTCKPPVGASVSVLLLMSIKKKKASSKPGEGDTLVSAISEETDAKIVDNTPRNATASGSLGLGTISLILNQATCEDEGTYICEVFYVDSKLNSFRPFREEELKVEVSTGQMSMSTTSAIPYPQETWKVKDKLAMTCLGPVGSVNISGVNSEPRITWVWQYRKGGTPWSAYDGPSTDITQSKFISIPNKLNNCYKNQSSTLLRNLTLYDSGREYRCFVRRGFQDQLQFTANFSVGAVTVDGKIPDVKEPSKSSSANMGAIIGGVFGALIVIAVIIIIIYFVVIRPRRQKAKEDVDDYTDKGDDTEAVPPYTPDPSVVYSQPTRRGKDKSEGVTNKGLDNSDDKPAPADTKLPADNDDRRYGRRQKEKKTSSAPHEADPAYDPPAHDGDDPQYAKPDRGHRDQRHRRHRDDDNEEKPASHERSRRHDNDRHGNDDHRRDGGGGRRRRDGDNYEEKPARYDDDYGHGRRNRGYEQDGRARGHHSSSEDGGMDSYVNTSQYSMGDGDPNIGTAI